MSKPRRVNKRERTLKTLWGISRNQCMFAGCESHPLSDPDWQGVMGEEAHIRGRRPGSARHDESMTDAERDDYSNLILLCPSHHRLIDGCDAERYPVDELLAIKARAEDRGRNPDAKWEAQLDRVVRLASVAYERRILIDDLLASAEKPPPSFEHLRKGPAPRSRSTVRQPPIQPLPMYETDELNPTVPEAYDSQFKPGVEHNVSAVAAATVGGTVRANATVEFPVRENDMSGPFVAPFTVVLDEATGVMEEIQQDGSRRRIPHDEAVDPRRVHRLGTSDETRWPGGGPRDDTIPSWSREAVDVVPGDHGGERSDQPSADVTSELARAFGQAEPERADDEFGSIRVAPRPRNRSSSTVRRPRSTD